MKTSRNKIIKQLLDCILEQISGVIAVYQFGSWGTKFERADSDLDIAILAEKKPDSIHLWKLAQKLAVMAHRDMDLLDMKTIPTVLRAQIISRGLRIYCSSENTANAFEANVLSSYAHLNEERKEILKQIEKQGTIYG